MPLEDPIKTGQLKHWDAVAQGWGAWLDWTDRNFQPLTDWLRRTTRWEPGARILDIASGAGYPALSAALSVRPGGKITATDLSPAMLAVAERRASAAGLDTIEFLEMDAEHLRFPDESFDAAMNVFGLMFCPDPQRAVVEMHRVLKPGGRFAIAVWDSPSRNRFFTLMLDLAATSLSMTPPAPAAPGPFRFAAAGDLELVLRAGGCSDVVLESRQMMFECSSLDEYRQLFTDVALKRRMAALSGTESARFQTMLADAAQPYLENGRLSLVATALCASGRR